SPARAAAPARVSATSRTTAPRRRRGQARPARSTGATRGAWKPSYQVCTIAPHGCYACARPSTARETRNMKMPFWLGLAALACTPAVAQAADDLDAIAREYLFLELSMGQHDPNHVDAYFGPESIRRAAEEAGLSLDEIESRAQALAERLERLARNDGDSLESARIASLLARLVALDTRIGINRGENLPFDEEARRLFGVAAPDYDAAHFAEVLEKIDALLPGEGELAARVDAFRERFVVPDERLPAVFEAAIGECRRRTLEHIALPEGESFRLEYVTDKPWTGYNWYEGDAQSLIQINRGLPIYVSRA